MTDTCRKCGRAILDGELVTGFDFSSPGGEHISCPQVFSDADELLQSHLRAARRASEVAWAVFESGRDMEPEEDVL